MLYLLIQEKTTQLQFFCLSLIAFHHQSSCLKMFVECVYFVRHNILSEILHQKTSVCSSLNVLSFPEKWSKYLEWLTEKILIGSQVCFGRVCASVELATLIKVNDRWGRVMWWLARTVLLYIGIYFWLINRVFVWSVSIFLNNTYKIPTIDRRKSPSPESGARVNWLTVQ